MSPVNRRGRRRLGPDAPVERLRGLLAEDALQGAAPLSQDLETPGSLSETPEAAEDDSEHTVLARAPVRWRVPWVAVVLAALVVVVLMGNIFWPGRDQDADPTGGSMAATVGAGAQGESVTGAPATATEHNSSPAASTTTAPSQIFVHVVGEVHRPGVVQIPGDARIQDAVEAAGGLTPEAVVTHVNLAAPVSDGAQILIPDVESAKAVSGTQDGGVQAPDVAETGGANTPAGAGPVNLNTASQSELETLPRVGPVTAQRIIEHREQVGGFHSVEELDDVTGIGPAMLASLTPLVTV